MRLAWLTDIHLNFLSPDARERLPSGGGQRAVRCRGCQRRHRREPQRRGLIAGNGGPLSGSRSISSSATTTSTTGRLPRRGQRSAAWSASPSISSISPRKAWSSLRRLRRWSAMTAGPTHGWATTNVRRCKSTTWFLSGACPLQQICPSSTGLGVRRAMESLAQEAADHFAKLLPDAISHYREVSR